MRTTTKTVEQIGGYRRLQLIGRSSTGELRQVIELRFTGPRADG